jgi:hypothetical protein
MSFEWISNGLQEEFLMPNQKAEETEMARWSGK